MVFALQGAACSASASDPAQPVTGGSAGAPSAGSAGALSNSGSSSGTASGGSAGVAGATAGTGSAAGAAGTGLLADCSPPADVFAPIEKLSQTGCVDPADPRKPSSRAVAYELNSPLWSDSADKSRAFLLPSGSKIRVLNCADPVGDCGTDQADLGRWVFPVGATLIKIFSFDSKLVETRLFMHLDADNWVGYSYRWNEAQTDATIVSSEGDAVSFNTGTRTVSWHYPSRDDCMNCHNQAGGSTLGPEMAQMNRMVGGSNQIDHFISLGVFANAPATPYQAALVTPYASQVGPATPGATVEQRARSYLHANCGFCHRPGSNFANFDLRNATKLADMGICKVVAQKGAIPNAPGKTQILVPGKSADSLLWLRMNEADPAKGRMPQVASYQADAAALGVVGDWINALGKDCPQ